MIDIEKLETLPHWENKRAYFVRNHGSYYNRKNHHSRNRSPYKIAERILKNNIGKSFDLAFHYYCTKIDKKDQYIFFTWFEDKRFRRFCGYHLDENNNIYYIPFKRGKRNIFYSIDYKTEYRHKLTGRKKPEYYWLYKKYKNENDYVPYIIQGFEKEFDSKNNREFRKLKAEKVAKQRKLARETKKLKEDKMYEFMTQYYKRLKEEKQKQKQLNEIKIISHGFDLITSFRK